MKQSGLHPWKAQHWKPNRDVEFCISCGEPTGLDANSSNTRKTPINEKGPFCQACFPAALQKEISGDEE